MRKNFYENQTKLMDFVNFSLEQIKSRFGDLNKYEWYSEDLYSYFRKLGGNAPFIVEHFAKIWYWGNVSDAKAQKIGLRNRKENYIHWAKEIIERIDNNEYDYNTGEGLQAGERPSIKTYDLNPISVPDETLKKILYLCLDSKSEDEFKDWVTEGIKREKGYPSIATKKIPSLRKSYLAFIYWLFIKMKSKKNFTEEINVEKIIRFAQEISKLKTNSNYEKKVKQIRFCEHIADRWELNIIELQKIGALPSEEMSFVEEYKDKIDSCKNFSYIPTDTEIKNF